jgi:hypothetical protein
MNASFEEKSVWIQLVSLVAVLGSYFAIAGLMLSKGVMVIAAYVSLFIVAVVLLVIVLVAGHIVVAVASKPEGRDERDRLIGWRAESNTGWILAVGVCAAITGLVASIENVYVAHLLVLSMLLSEVAKCVLQLVYYRRGL